MSSTASTTDKTVAKVDNLDNAERKITNTAKKASNEHQKLDFVLKNIGRLLITAGFNAVKMAGNILGAGSAAVTAGLALAKLAVATAHYAAAVGPAAAALLPLAAGALFVKQVVVLAGPAMLKAITPITAAWTKQGVAVGKLASAGIRPLAQAFVKANFPAISKSMDSIAKSTNQAATFAIKWSNSAAGQKVIAQLAGDAADAFKRLAPFVTALGISLALMAGRISHVSFKNFGDAAQYVLTKLNAFVDSITEAKVQHAFDTIKSTGEAAGRGLRALGNGLKFVQEHMNTINMVRQAIAGLAIVVGIATGGWLAILGGAITLVVMNWSTLVDVFHRVSDWVTNLGQKFPSLSGPMDAVRGVVNDIKDAFGAFVDDIGPHVQPFLDRVGDAFIRLQPAITGVISLLGDSIAFWLRFAGPILGVVIAAIGLIIDGFSHLVEFVTFAVAGIEQAFGDMLSPLAKIAKKLHLPFADAFQEAADDAHRAAARMTANLAQTKVDLAVREVDRLQKKVNSLKGKKVKTEADRKAIADSEARIRQLNRNIQNLRGKTVTIHVNTQYAIYGNKGGSYQGGTFVPNKWMGGAVRGPGSGTSDSILTRLSNGEHIISAAEVKRLGGHAAIERLRKGITAGGQASTAPAGYRSGGGGGVVLLRIESGGSSMDDLLVQIMRKAVRVKGGGNVQKALGQ
jgi:hypothetical protein